MLVDFENIVRPPDTKLIASIANWVGWFEDGQFDPQRRRRTFLSKRVYWNSHCEGHRPIFERQGFDAFACPAAVKDKKSAADIWIALDAIDLLAEHKALQEVIILSTDTDFVPVVNRLREKNKSVVVLGNEANLSAGLYALHADVVVPLTDLRMAATYTRANKTWWGGARKDPVRVVVRQQAEQPVAAPAERNATAQPQAKISSPPKFDLTGAAAMILQAAEAQPGLYISRETVRNVLRGVSGFATTGKYPWLGCGNYCSMLAEMAKRQTKLEHTRYNDGGCAIRARK